MEERRLRSAAPVAGLLAVLLPLALLAVGKAPVRRIAIRVAPGLSVARALDGFSGWARQEGLEIEVGPEDLPIPPGWEAVRVAILPAAESFRRSLVKFPVRLARTEFSFDGRAYGRPGDAIALSDPSRPGEVFVLGVDRQAARRLLAWRLFGRGEEGAADYRVLSGDLSKAGRFTRGASLAIDRGSDKDEIVAREDFFRRQKEESRGGVRWRFQDSERGAVLRWEPFLRRFLGQGSAGPILVVLFPDPATKGRYTGSSRPADLSKSGSEVRVDLDASAPREPDLISPVLHNSSTAYNDAPM